MANKSLLLGLIFILQNFSNLAFASTPPTDCEYKNKAKLLCEAPTPDSFWVSSRGADFITVDWIPAWTDAQHTLKIHTRTDSTLPWLLIDSFNNIQGSTYTFNGILFDEECQVTIATNCSDGQSSFLTKSIQDKIIIELATGGRIPVNPVPISCMNLPSPNPNPPFNWVGFQVIQNNGFTIQNTFEVVVTHPTNWITKVSINRVFENNVVFASDNDNIIPPPTLQLTIPIFKIIKRALNQDYSIGKLEVRKSNSSIDLCQYNYFPWNNAYEFIPIKATALNGNNNPYDISYQQDFGGTLEQKIDNKMGAQSPFYETLRIFVGYRDQTKVGNCIVRLMDMSGKIIFDQQITEFSEIITIPTETVTSGIYMLKVETETEIQTLKVIKGG